MNRINKEDVLRAYEELNIIPLTDDWCYINDEGKKCACAISVLAAKEIGFNEVNNRLEKLYSNSDKTINSENTYEVIRDMLGGRYGAIYLEDFVVGFDGYGIDLVPKNANKNYKLGYNDGLETRNLIFGNMGTPVSRIK